MVIESVNRHDTMLFDESFTNLLDLALDIPLSLSGSCLTLDSGFDSVENRAMIEQAGMIPVIKPNVRRAKQEKINQRFEDFDPLENIYQERYVIERCFAWEDTYRKLVTRYEKLQSTFMGFRYLAWSMMNLRSFFKNYRLEKRRNLI